MNDLTKEAISRELNPDRPLTGKPEHYLTGDEGSECFTLDAWPMSLFKHQLPNKPVDIDKFRKFCEEIGE